MILQINSLDLLFILWLLRSLEGVSKEKIGVPLPIPLEVPLLAIVQIRAKNNVVVEAASSRDFKFVTT